MNEARRPPNITINSSYQKNINNNIVMTCAQASEWNGNDDNNANIITVIEDEINEHILQSQSSLLPGEVRTPSFIVTMSDWAATTASGNYTANRSVAWSEDNNNAHSTTNSCMASQRRAENPTSLTTHHVDDDNVVWNAALQPHSLPRDVAQVKTQLQLEGIKDEAVMGTFTASHSIHSLNSSLAPSRTTLTQQQQQQQLLQQQLQHNHVNCDVTSNNDNMNGNTATKLNTEHQNNSPASLEIVHGISATKAVNDANTVFSGNNNNIINNNLNNSKITSEPMRLATKQAPTRWDDVATFHSHSTDLNDTKQKQENELQTMQESEKVAAAAAADHEEDNEANPISYFTVQEGNDNSFVQDHLNSNHSNNNNIININNNLVDAAAAATVTLGNIMNNGNGCVEIGVNGGIVHHATMRGMGMSNVKTHSYYNHINHNGNSPAMMTLNSTFINGGNTNIISIPFTYLPTNNDTTAAAAVAAADAPDSISQMGMHNLSRSIAEAELVLHGSGLRDKSTPLTAEELSRHSSQLAALHTSSHGSPHGYTHISSLQPELYAAVNYNIINANINNISTSEELERVLSHSSLSSSRRFQPSIVPSTNNVATGISATADNRPISAVVQNVNNINQYASNVPISGNNNNNNNHPASKERCNTTSYNTESYVEYNGAMSNIPSLSQPQASQIHQEDNRTRMQLNTLPQHNHLYNDFSSNNSNTTKYNQLAMSSSANPLSATPYTNNGGIVERMNQQQQQQQQQQQRSLFYNNSNVNNINGVIKDSNNNVNNIMSTNQNQTNVFAQPMQATGTYSLHDNYSMPLQQQQAAYYPSNAFQSTNKSSAVNNSTMTSRVHPPHTHQSYQELVEKSIGDVAKFIASNFPPPPPPRVHSRQRRHAMEKWYKQAENWDALQRLAPPPRNPLPEMEVEYELQLPALTRVPYHGERWLSNCEYWFDYVQRLFAFPESNKPVQTNVTVILDNAVLE